MFGGNVLALGTYFSIELLLEVVGKFLGWPENIHSVAEYITGL